MAKTLQKARVREPERRNGGGLLEKVEGRAHLADRFHEGICPYLFCQYHSEGCVDNSCNGNRREAGRLIQAFKRE